MKEYTITITEKESIEIYRALIEQCCVNLPNLQKETADMSDYKKVAILQRIIDVCGNIILKLPASLKIT